MYMCMISVFFFFKQKTAYELRISDWSSDVCSSDLLVKCAVDVIDKRIPVVAATGSQSHAETVVLTEFAARAGADALLVVTPYYIRPPQRGLVEFYADIGARSDLPLMIYHIPGRRSEEHTSELQSLMRI